MENLNMVVARRPRVFAQILLGLMREGGDAIMERLFWGTGTIQYHPKPCVEAMAAFEFPEDLLEGAGLYAPLSQITDDGKAGLFAGNYARLHDIDLNAIKAQIANDDFARPQAEGLAKPWSSAAAIPAAR